MGKLDLTEQEVLETQDLNEKQLATIEALERDVKTQEEESKLVEEELRQTRARVLAAELALEELEDRIDMANLDAEASKRALLEDQQLIYVERADYKRMQKEKAEAAVRASIRSARVAAKAATPKLPRRKVRRARPVEL